MDSQLVLSIKSRILSKLIENFGKTLEQANKAQLYKATALTLRDDIMQRWQQSTEHARLLQSRRLYYLSVEFLLGRSLSSNLLNMALLEEYACALNELGLSLDELAGAEPDPGLGNGGLGRLAACFMDSLASLGLPATGFCIRYEYGLFRQKIEDSEQKELPDNWLGDGNVWEVQRPEDAVEVRFGGKVEELWSEEGLKIRHTGYSTVLAVPYDMPMVGSGGHTVNTLRLWSAMSPKRLDMDYFSRGDYTKAMEEKELAEVISKVLYPQDNNPNGKSLRLKQQYFFSAASIACILRDFKATGQPLARLGDYAVIQINDTHPALAIPELMRVLLDEEGLGWQEAWDIVTSVFNYTNHTVMSEALERWPVELISSLLPRIYSILVAMNEHWCRRLWNFYPGQWDRIGQMAIIGYGEVRMANLAIAASANINSVSAQHGDILKHGLFRDFYLAEPWKFTAITNGVTHRRWLMLSNPRLAAAVTDAIGEGWKQDPEKLEALLPLASDPAFLSLIESVKHANKLRLCEYLRETQGENLDPSALFDVQAKRLHEYKRQLLNILHVLYLYDRLLNEPGFTMPPQTFIFGAKAPPGYALAKRIISLIIDVSKLCRRTPEVCDVLKVVFLENYGVTSAQVLIPAAEVSEQISTAGKEASGTGNMKFMMNGALTLGTLDGANAEIYRRVGDDGMFLFGLKPEETAKLYKTGAYSAGRLYESSPMLRKVLDYLINGALRPGATQQYEDIYHSLLFGNPGSMADEYLVLADFAAYVKAQERVRQTYANKALWNAMSVKNIALSGIFSSDRTVAEYNARIWRLKAVK